MLQQSTAPVLSKSYHPSKYDAVLQAAFLLLVGAYIIVHWHWRCHWRLFRFSVSVHRPCIVSFDDFQYPRIVRASFPSKVLTIHALSVHVALRGSAVSVHRPCMVSEDFQYPCTVRASLPSKVVTIQARSMHLPCIVSFEDCRYLCTVRASFPSKVFSICASSAHLAL